MDQDQDLHPEQDLDQDLDQGKPPPCTSLPGSGAMYLKGEQRTPYCPKLLD